MNYYVKEYISSVITKATGMMNHFTVELPPEDLYAMLCGNDRQMLDTFSHAARYMGRDSYHGVLTIPVSVRGAPNFYDVTFTVSIESTERYYRYLMPKHIGILTPESKLYDRLWPGIQLAQDWKITESLFDMFSPTLSIDQMAFVLPWLKDLGHDGVIAFNHDSVQFLRRHNITDLNDAKKISLKAGLERLAKPGRAANTPALTSRINAATRIGDRLFAQWRLLRDKATPDPRGSFVAIAVTDKMLPDWYGSDMAGILANWEREEFERRTELAQKKDLRLNKAWTIRGSR